MTTAKNIVIRNNCVLPSSSPPRSDTLQCDLVWDPLDADGHGRCLPRPLQTVETEPEACFSAVFSPAPNTGCVVSSLQLKVFCVNAAAFKK
jgi:hypothetical protein